jgi:hypothetical protein
VEQQHVETTRLRTLLTAYQKRVDDLSEECEAHRNSGERMAVYV